MLSLKLMEVGARPRRWLPSGGYNNVLSFYVWIWPYFSDKRIALADGIGIGHVESGSRLNVLILIVIDRSKRIQRPTVNAGCETFP